MNKYAILFSGQPRYREIAIKSIIENLIDINECDIFGHFWKYENFNLPNYMMNYPALSNIANNRDIIDYSNFDYQLTNLKKSFDFKSIEIEEQINFDTNKYHPGLEKNSIINEFGIEKAIKHFGRANFISQSQWNSLNKVNNIKCKYEDENNFKYKGVLRFRTDILLPNKLNLEKYDTVKINIPHYSTNINSNSILVIADLIAYGSSEIMDKYCNFYNHQDTILKPSNVENVEYDALLGNPIAIHIRNNIGNDNVISNNFNFPEHPVKNIIR